MYWFSGSNTEACLIGFPACGIELVLCMGEEVLEVVPKDAARLHPQIDRPCTASSIWHRVQHKCAVVLLQATLTPQVPCSVLTTGTAWSDAKQGICTMRCSSFSCVRLCRLKQYQGLKTGGVKRSV